MWVVNIYNQTNNKVKSKYRSENTVYMDLPHSGYAKFGFDVYNYIHCYNDRVTTMN